MYSISVSLNDKNYQLQVKALRWNKQYFSNMDRPAENVRPRRKVGDHWEKWMVWTFDSEVDGHLEIK